MPTTTYSTTQAAQMIGASPRWVRGVITAGFEPTRRAPKAGAHARLSAADVDRLRALWALRRVSLDSADLCISDCNTGEALVVRPQGSISMPLARRLRDALPGPGAALIVRVT